MSANISVEKQSTNNDNNTTITSISSITSHDTIQQRHSLSANTTTTQMMTKLYQKAQFLQIIQQLAQEDPLYYCQQQNLQMIYQKTIQHEGKFTGVELMEFAKALKQRNKDRFKEQIKFYKQYINLNKEKEEKYISSRQLLNSVYLNQQVGYLTATVYEMVRQEELVSIQKLQEMIDDIQREFKESQRVSIPKKVEIKRKTVYLDDQEEYQEEVVFELQQPDSSSYVASSKAAQQIVTVQFITQLKQQILQSIQSNQNQQQYNNIQKQFNKLQQSVQVINEHTFPSMREQIQTLREYNLKMQEQLNNICAQLDNKQSQLIASKNALLEVTQQNKLTSKQLFNCKLLVNQKDEVIYQLEEELAKAQNDKATLQNKTESFFSEYSSLKEEYERFVEQARLDEERKTHAQQANLLPTISLKQQLQDAQFKIKKLKSDKEQLLKDMQNNQNIFALKLVNLQKELEEAKMYNNNNKGEQLKFLGMSRLSRNYQQFMSNSKSLVRKSIYSSVIGSVIAESRLPPQYQPQQQSHQFVSNRMSTYIQQVDNIMMLERSKRKQLSRYNNRQSYVERVIVDDDESSNNMVGMNGMINGKSIFGKKLNNQTIAKTKQSQNHLHQHQHQQQQQNKQQQQFQLTDKLEEQFYRQSKVEEPKFNFTQVDFEQLKKKWKTEHPDVLHDDEKIEKAEEEELKKSTNNNNLDANINNNILQMSRQYSKISPQTMFITPTDIISKSGTRYKKHLLFNRKGIFMFDTKLRLEKIFKYTKIMNITFTYFNLDTFVVSFKRKERSEMKKKTGVSGHDGDLVFKCLRTRQLISFLSQPLFRLYILRQSQVKITIQKQSNTWIHDSSDKDAVLTNCGNYYNPFKLNLSLKNQSNKMFFAQLSRENYFSRSYIITCVIEEFGVYCFEWYEDELDRERRFIYLLPLVKRMVFIREVEGDMVKVVYEDWSDGKTFLLRFKNHKESLRFQTMCKHQLKTNLKVLQDRRKRIEKLFEYNNEHQDNKSNNTSPKREN